MEGISFNSVAGQSASSGLNQSRQNQVETSSPTFNSLFEEASLSRKFGEERADAIEHLASRVTSIASRLSGSYPFGDPATNGAKAGERIEPSSTLAAVQDAISGLRVPLIRMDPAIRELAAAIEVLERAFG